MRSSRWNNSPPLRILKTGRNTGEPFVRRSVYPDTEGEGEWPINLIVPIGLLTNRKIEMTYLHYKSIEQRSMGTSFAATGSNLTVANLPPFDPLRS
jgi:hypothetical protein